MSLWQSRIVRTPLCTLCRYESSRYLFYRLFGQLWIALFWSSNWSLTNWSMSIIWKMEYFYRNKSCALAGFFKFFRTIFHNRVCPLWQRSMGWRIGWLQPLACCSIEPARRRNPRTRYLQLSRNFCSWCCSLIERSECSLLVYFHFFYQKLHTESPR